MGDPPEGPREWIKNAEDEDQSRCGQAPSQNRNRQDPAYAGEQEPHPHEEVSEEKAPASYRHLGEQVRPETYETTASRVVSKRISPDAKSDISSGS